MEETQNEADYYPRENKTQFRILHKRLKKKITYPESPKQVNVPFTRPFIDMSLFMILYTYGATQRGKAKPCASAHGKEKLRRNIEMRGK